MKTPSARAQLNQETVEQASAWFVEFRVGDADAAAREEFNHWLRRSPEHVRAYLEIARTYAELPSTPAQELDVDALIAYARSDSNVVPLTARAQRPAVPITQARTRRAKQLAIAASVLIAALAGFMWLDSQRGVYSTDIGEQRSVMLSDGSTVELNARSRIRVRYSDRLRNVELLEGQALFKVAKNPALPFIVRSGSTDIRAVGTQFDVYRRKSGTTVTVLEGRVAVFSTRKRIVAVEEDERHFSSTGRTAAIAEPVLPAQTFLSAGEKVTVTGERVAAPTPANVAAATAWTQRRLVFEGLPLTQVAEEFNRYTTRPLIVDDAQLEDFHISGVYSSTEPASLLRFLREQPGIRVIETDTEIRISRSE
jgi:transmembrane sensor